MQKAYRNTMFACYNGFVTQAIINNLAPLLFVIFQEQFNISLEKISFLILLNFSVQLLVDGLCIKFADRIGYRPLIVAAHILCALGLVFLSVLPFALGYAGLLIAVVTYAAGGGIIEVLVSPIADAIPKANNPASMSLLHSFYCWGHVAVVILTTVALRFIGSNAWPVLPVLWAIIPVANAFRFGKVPIIMPTVEKRVSIRSLLSNQYFLLAILLMIASGASEQAMSQWASFFAEKGLYVSKMAGDLLGPCLFAVLMGAGRVLFGTYGKKMKETKALSFCAVLCVLCYLITSLSTDPPLALVGCAVTGFSISLMWPGMISFSAHRFEGGGTAMFSLLALGGDIGCAIGPWMTGIVSAVAQKSERIVAIGAEKGLDAMQTGLKTGLLMAIVFPVLFIVGMVLFSRRETKKIGPPRGSASGAAK